MEVRISFTFVLTVVTLVLSLVPAVTIWVVFMDLMTSSVNLLQQTTQTSMDKMTQSIQKLLMEQAVANFDAMLAETEKEMGELVTTVKASGVLRYDLRPSRWDVYQDALIPFHTPTYVVAKAHPYFTQVTVTAAAFPNPTDNFTTPSALFFWVVWLAFMIDIVQNTVGNRTLYLIRMAMEPEERWASMNISYVDPDTGTILVPLAKEQPPYAFFVKVSDVSGWSKTMTFNIYSGFVELSLWQWLPAQNKTYIQTYISVGAAVISDELQSQLDGYPNDRLVLFFRQPHGYMIAASHGKFWSDSDVDNRFVNVLLHPPNVTGYRLWNCTSSNDALIHEACHNLYSTYQSWPAIPQLNIEMPLAGQRYWVSTGYNTGNLQVTVLLLKNRTEVMGSIDASDAQVDRRLADRKAVTFVILGVISATAAALPVAAALWLAHRLYALAEGMDHIAQLQFATKAPPPTVFLELHRFQSSFIQMERGLRAFGKFVPQAVVKVLIAGQLHVDDKMTAETLTVMFVDIESFSTICVTETPAVLVAVCTEYFEAMCSNIVKHNGTVDKFIGDCIMAMWNAPDPLVGHEREAVAAALAMQDRVMQLQQHWRSCKWPVLRFRLGLHTGVCLVGNFGCSYRVNYTCLGDGVNLSARLEDVNKKFGTYLCVSHATYEGCHEYFHFRQLAQVAVPGKAEAIPVYEVLCLADGADPRSPKSDHRVGFINLAEDDLDEVEEGDTSAPLPLPGQYPTDGRSAAQRVPGRIAYHWTHMDRSAVLHHARNYERAYDALMYGDKYTARRLLSMPLMNLPDPAWTLLQAQLEKSEAGKPWDGVFSFAAR